MSFDNHDFSCVSVTSGSRPISVVQRAYFTMPTTTGFLNGVGFFERGAEKNWEAIAATCPRQGSRDPGWNSGAGRCHRFAHAKLFNFKGVGHLAALPELLSSPGGGSYLRQARSSLCNRKGVQALAPLSKLLKWFHHRHPP